MENMEHEGLMQEWQALLEAKNRNGQRNDFEKESFGDYYDVVISFEHHMVIVLIETRLL